MQQCDLVLFGTHDDLARRKLLPSLHLLERMGLINPESIIGGGRGESTDEQHLALIRKSLEMFGKRILASAVWDCFARRLGYVRADLSQPKQHVGLLANVDQSGR